MEGSGAEGDTVGCSDGLGLMSVKINVWSVMQVIVVVMMGVATALEKTTKVIEV